MSDPAPTSPRRTLRDRVVVITGASMGIGEATARAFAREGAKVVLGARSEPALAKLAGEIGALHVRCDVTKEADCDALVNAALEAYGRIDVLVNNAGLGLWSPVADLSAEELHRLFEVNVYGVQRLVRRVVPIMRRQRGGQIVNVSSVLGHRAVPMAGGYCASKFALQALSDSLRLEVAPDGIDVIVIAPGQVSTEFKRNTVRGAASPVDREDRASRAGVSAGAVADAIVGACRRKRREVDLTLKARALILANRVSPVFVDFVLARVFRDQIEAARRAPGGA